MSILQKFPKACFVVALMCATSLLVAAGLSEVDAKQASVSNAQPPDGSAIR